jgi:FKBP-type peptidyl-prolyl cis-trans isomerase FkpA/FKBP-type peptidyl-prolyl cis-trans isomerase FklB
MQQGGKATFYVPSALGYGPTSSGVIIANSNLIFEVELLEVFPNVQ